METLLFKNFQRNNSDKKEFSHACAGCARIHLMILTTMTMTMMTMTMMTMTIRMVDSDDARPDR